LKKKQYYIYVGQLKKDFAKTKKAKKKNPDADLTKSCIYVGYSDKPPQERWDQHLNQARNDKGPLFSRVAARWGENYLHWKKFKKHNPIPTKKLAEKLEEKIALHYRDKGFTVWSDKLPYINK
tara:strand:+ start:162 stop:530 length:369 start_codon:yes stop_codon:yes gene_type:complete